MNDKVHHQLVRDHATKPGLFGLDPEPGKVSNDDIVAVFDFWVTTCYLTPSMNRRPALTAARRTAIRTALRTHGPTVVYCAIDAASRSPWHQGHNTTGRRHIDLAYLLSGERITTLAAESPYAAQQSFLDGDR